LKAFSKLRQEVTYRTVTRTYSGYSDVVETNSDDKIYAVLEEIDSAYIESRGGLVPEGDLIAFVLQDVKSNLTALAVTISKKNHIVYNSIVYEIVDIKNDSLGQFYKMLTLKKVN
jgi:hypothetical protein